MNKGNGRPDMRPPVDEFAMMPNGRARLPPPGRKIKFHVAVPVCETAEPIFAVTPGGVATIKPTKEFPDGEKIVVGIATGGAGYMIVRDAQRPTLIGLPAPERKPFLSVSVTDLMAPIMEALALEAGAEGERRFAYDAALSQNIVAMLDAKWRADPLRYDFFHVFVGTQPGFGDVCFGDLLDDAAGRERRWWVTTA